MLSDSNLKKLEFLGKNNNTGSLIALCLYVFLSIFALIHLWSKSKTSKLSLFILLPSLCFILIIMFNLQHFRGIGLFYSLFFDIEHKKIILMKNCIFRKSADISLNNKKYRFLSEFDLEDFILEKLYLIGGLTVRHSKKRYLYVNIDKSPLKNWFIENVEIDKYSRFKI